MKRAIRIEEAAGLGSLTPCRPLYTRKLKKVLGSTHRGDAVHLRVLQEGRECTPVEMESVGSSVSTDDTHAINSTDSVISTNVPEAIEEQVPEQDIGSYAGPILGVAALLGVVALTAVFKDDITTFLEAFVTQVEGMGPSGLIAYAALYIVLETLAVPATPLTLTAGYLFGQTQGTLVVSCSATIAALLAFLIARYAARDKVAEIAASNKQFTAIDKAIKKDGFKFVFLLRLSPLLPFAASNYLYGLTSVETRSYMLASWLGMLPGTWAYVSAGSVGRDIVNGGSSSFSPLEIGLACGVTAAVLWMVGNIAKNALAEVEEEETGA